MDKDKTNHFEIKFFVQKEGKQHQVGRFFENADGKLDFVGDLTEAGEVFIEHVLSNFNKNRDS